MRPELRGPEEYDLAIPDASSLIESMRSFGYSTETAIADLVDNSISADARNVAIDAFWDGPDSYIRVADNGHGMSEQELVSAMHLGSQNPRDKRAASDLGRFGLGLKSASFSQCRNVTVASRREGQAIASRRWDLDYVATTREWRLLHDPDPASWILIAPLESASHGTIVLWQRMDRIVDDRPAENELARRRFLQLVSELELHISMIFHRLMRPRGVEIVINGNRVEAWDPFLKDSPATQWLGQEALTFDGAEIQIQPYVLPHHSKISEPVHRSASGTRGWNAHQGFYVYRARRLIVPGSWLGLGLKQEEHYKLARIQVDIPNSMDEAWQLDVRKSQARPPGPLREDFRRIATIARSAASDVYRHRGKRVTTERSREEHLPWLRLKKHGKISYRINRKYPLAEEVLRQLGDERKRLESLLVLLEETVPIPAIAIDNAEHPDSLAAPLEDVSPEQIQALLVAFYCILREHGRPHVEAMNQLRQTEPFSRVPEIIETVEPCITKECLHDA